MSNNPRYQPQTPQLQRPQQQGQNGSMYADPGSPIASAVQRNKNKLQSPTTGANTETRVQYTPAQQQYQQQQSPATQQGTTAPRSPKMFSPRGAHQHHQMNPNPSTRYRHPDTIDTALVESEIPFLHEFGTVSLPARNNGVNYIPPCWVPIFKLLESHMVRRTTAYDDPQAQHMAQMEYDNIIKDIVEELQSFYIIRSLPALPRSLRKSPIPPKRADAPRISLVLDLDETLVHCTLNSNDNCAFTFPVEFNSSSYVVSAQVRPHLEHFLRQVSQWFEVIIFTASQKSYADSLLNIIDPMNEFITHRLFRDSCVHVENNFIKDLSVLGRPLEHVIIVDNSVQAFGYHLNNGIPIESWFTDDTDGELLTLLSLLRHLKDVHDVRPYLRDYFRTQEFIDQLPE